MIILLGGAGYVGSAFRAFFDAHGIIHRVLSRDEVGGDAARLATLLRDIRPAFLVCAAGYTGKPNVDACELSANKAPCLAGNAVLPGLVRAACEAADVPWGHVSSGCVFTGAKGTDAAGNPLGFTEDDTPNFSFRQDNCSFYSGTKALGEEILRDAPGCYVWRLRIPFDHVDSPRNYLTKMMRYDRLLDAANSLSHLGDFVRACWECFEKRVPAGIYNVTNPGHVTTREVVELLLRSGVTRKAFSFFADEAEFMRVAAKTPRSNCVLDSSKLARHGIVLPEVHEAVAGALRRWETVA